MLDRVTERRCKLCGGEILSSHKARQYCSSECSYKYHLIKRVKGSRKPTLKNSPKAKLYGHL
jgi:ribosomal protein S27AE